MKGADYCYIPIEEFKAGKQRLMFGDEVFNGLIRRRVKKIKTKTAPSTTSFCFRILVFLGLLHIRDRVFDLLRLFIYRVFDLLCA